MVTGPSPLRCYAGMRQKGGLPAPLPVVHHPESLAQAAYRGQHIAIGQVLLARPGLLPWGEGFGIPNQSYLFVFLRLALEHCRSCGMLERVYTKTAASL